MRAVTCKHLMGFRKSPPAEVVTNSATAGRNMDDPFRLPLSCPAMIRFPAAALLLMVVSCAPAVSLEGKKITSVGMLVEGGKTVDEARLRNFMKTRPGMRYTPALLDEDLRSLYQSGLVEEAAFQAEPDGEAVRVTATVKTRLGSGPLRFVGNENFSPVRLGGECGLRHDTPIHSKTLEQARRKLEAFYHRQGYQEAKVATEFHPFPGDKNAPPEMDDFYFQIEEGTRIRSSVRTPR